MCLTRQTGIRRFIRSPRWKFLSGLVFVSACWAARSQSYSATDLGTLGGANGMAYGLNNREQIVGAAQTSMGGYHAFMFDGGQMVDLGTLGGSNSWCYGVNDSGWAVGGAELPTTNLHGFLCTNAQMNSMMDLGTLGGSNSAACMINVQGDVVGWAAMTNGNHHAFFMTNSFMGRMMDLGTVGGTNSEAYCVNSNQMVVGDAMMANGDEEPIMSTNAMFGSSSMMMMGMGNMGASGGQSWFVNNMGDTVGAAQMGGGNHHAIVSGGGGMMGPRTVDLGTLGGSNSTAYCINDAGMVVGMAQLSNGTMHAFMVSNALGGMVRMVDLNTLVPTNSGWELLEARGLNAAGQIVGWGMLAGHTNAFLLTPVSAPVTMTLAPNPQIVGPGTMVGLQVQMSAKEPLTYQWLHNGTPMLGATNSVLNLPGMSVANAGEYTVTVRNAVGTVAMSSALVSMFGMQVSNRMPSLTVASTAGAHFRIDYSDRLGLGANWRTLTNVTLMGAMSQASDLSALGADARFYRAVMLP